MVENDLSTFFNGKQWQFYSIQDCLWRISWATAIMVFHRTGRKICCLGFDSVRCLLDSSGSSCNAVVHWWMDRSQSRSWCLGIAYLWELARQCQEWSHRVNCLCVSTIVNSCSTTVLDLPFLAFTFCSLITSNTGVETMLWNPSRTYFPRRCSSARTWLMKGVEERLLNGLDLCCCFGVHYELWSMIAWSSMIFFDNLWSMQDIGTLWSCTNSPQYKSGTHCPWWYFVCINRG